MRKYYSPIYRANEPGKALQLSPVQWLAISLALVTSVLVGALLGSGIVAPAYPETKAIPTVERERPGAAFNQATVASGLSSKPAGQSSPGQAQPSATPAATGESSGIMNSLQKSELWNKSG